MSVLLCRLLQRLEIGSTPVYRQHEFHQFAGHHQSSAVSVAASLRNPFYLDSESGFNWTANPELTGHLIRF
jgi:hypothetical protein